MKEQKRGKRRQGEQKREKRETSESEYRRWGKENEYVKEVRTDRDKSTDKKEAEVVRDHYCKAWIMDQKR